MRRALLLIAVIGCNGGSSNNDPNAREVVAGLLGSATSNSASSAPGGAQAPGACASAACPGGCCPSGANCDVSIVPPVRFPASQASAGVAGIVVADFTGDNRLDVITSSAGTLLLLRGTATGFAAATNAGSPGTGQQISFVAGDIDNDADVDVVAGVVAQQAYVVMLNDGVGTFVAQAPVTVAAPAGKEYALGDLNNDDKLDLVDDWGGTFLGNANGTFTATQTGTTGPNNVTKVGIADLDGNGARDIYVSESYMVAIGGNPNRISHFLGNGDGTVGPRGTSMAVRHIAVGDLIGDAKPEAIVPIYNTTNYGYALPTTSGLFQTPTAFSPSGQTTRLFLIADLTGDGVTDFVAGEAAAATNQAGVVRLVPRITGTTFDQPITVPLTDGALLRSPLDGAVGDVNGDGRLDLIVIDGLDSVWVLLGVAADACSISGTAGTCGNGVSCADGCCPGSTCPCSSPTPKQCPAGATLCGDGSTCCLDGYTCGEGGACFKIDDGPAPGACSTGFCAAGSTCDNGTCCSADYPIGCGDVCCLPGGTCEGTTCGCPSTTTACGASCCAAGDLCVDGLCRPPCTDAAFPTMCGLECCGPGVACTNGRCDCAPDHPVTCESSTRRACCLDGASCQGGSCDCPAGRAACGASCCASGDTCVDGVCKRPSSGGTCLNGSSRACIDFGANGGCDGCTGNPSTCMPFSEWTSRGFTPPASCKPAGETGCFYHAPDGVDNFLIEPCCAGLTCQVGPGCSNGADTGTCL